MKGLFDYSVTFLFVSPEFVHIDTEADAGLGIICLYCLLAPIGKDKSHP